MATGRVAVLRTYYIDIVVELQQDAEVSFDVARVPGLHVPSEMLEAEVDDVKGLHSSK